MNIFAQTACKMNCLEVQACLGQAKRLWVHSQRLDSSQGGTFETRYDAQPLRGIQQSHDKATANAQSDADFLSKAGGLPQFPKSQRPDIEGPSWVLCYGTTCDGLSLVVWICLQF
jgi:hypothetical protein